MLHLHPAKRATFLEKLVIRVRKEGEKLFFKKLFKTLARLKRSCTFAPANREVGDKIENESS